MMKCRSVSVADTSSDMLSSFNCEGSLSEESTVGHLSLTTSRAYTSTHHYSECSKQQLLDRIEDLLKKINFNKELIESYDEFFKNQSSVACDLRLELQELSVHVSSDSTLSPSWDYQALFDQSENSPDSDVPASTQIAEEFIMKKNGKDVTLSQSDRELVTYLVDREREIIRLQHFIANNSDRNPWDNGTKGAIKKVEEGYVKRYWEMWEQNKKLKHILSEIRAKEHSLVDQLQEQEQLTVFYAYLNHSSERDHKEHELTEDSFSDDD